MSASTGNTGIDLSIKTTDHRYPVNVNIDDKDEFTLLFNPGNPFTLRYAESLQNINISNGWTSAAVDEIETAIDGIFGSGAAQKIFRYDGPGFPLMWAVLGKVQEGIADYKEKAKAAEDAARAEAVIEAKKDAAAYQAP